MLFEDTATTRARSRSKRDISQLPAKDVPGPLSTLYRSGTKPKSRASGLVRAAEAVGPIAKGSVTVGITKGGFSMLDMIEHALDVTGPADVDVSTWTMGVYDADVLWRFASEARIRRIRFLLDSSMFGGMGDRKAELARGFIAAFGGENMRAVENHAKFVTIGNEDWKVTITSSMNLNRNKRLENFVVIEYSGIYEFHRSIVDGVFESVGPYWSDPKRSYAEWQAMTLPGAVDAEASVVW